MRPHSLLVFNIAMTANFFAGIGLGFAPCLDFDTLGGGPTTDSFFGGTLGSGGRFDPSRTVAFLGGGPIGSGGFKGLCALPLPLGPVEDEAS